MGNSFTIDPKSNGVIKTLTHGTRKRKVTVCERETVSCSSYWSEGSIDYWEARTLTRVSGDGPALYVVGHSPARVNLGSGFPSFAEGENVLSPGLCLVRTGVFRGKESTPTVYLHPSDYQALFPDA